jgi:hypothetical protein
MWVATDCRSKNWVAVLKSLGKLVYSAKKFMSVSTQQTDESWSVKNLLMAEYKGIYCARDITIAYYTSFHLASSWNFLNEVRGITVLRKSCSCFVKQKLSAIISCAAGHSGRAV